MALIHQHWSRTLLMGVIFVLLLVYFHFRRGPLSGNAVFTISTWLFFFYLAASALLAIFVHDFWTFSWQSLLWNIGLVVLLMFLGMLYLGIFKVKSGAEAGIGFMTILFYPVFLAVAGLIRWIITLF